MKELRYQEFRDRINLDVLYEALEWEPIRTKDNEDIGQCFDVHQLHKHGDTTGKLAINREKMVYNCWVCGGGSLLSLVMELKNMDVEEATKWLYQFTDTRHASDMQWRSFLTAKLEALNPIPQSQPVLPWFNDRVLRPWEANVNQTDWFDKRHISGRWISYFNLGFDPEHIKQDYCGPAIILPHFWESRLVGWQERWLDNDRPKWLGKYTNTPDFPRKRTLWGYHQALNEGPEPIVVESVPTAIMLWSYGYPAIATFGSSVTHEQVSLLRVFQRGIIASPDNDGAGRRWLNSITGGLESYIPIGICEPVEGEGSDLGDIDPADLKSHLALTRFHGYAHM